MMKKITAAVLAATLTLSMSAALSSCARTQPGDGIEITEFRPSEPEYTWPENHRLFNDIPAPEQEIDTLRENKTDRGYSWEITIKKMSYAQFRAYILKLEESGFSFYDASGTGITTDSVLPKKLASGREFASWSGHGNLLWLSANWQSNKQLKKTGGDNNVSMTFTTYNPRTTVSAKTTEEQSK